MELMVKKDKISSLEVLEQINLFRKEEGNRAELQHKDLLKIVRDEFEEEINEGKISPVEYKDKKGENRPMFILSLNQDKQVLVRESKLVRRAVIKHIENLENKLKCAAIKEQELLENKYNNQFLMYKEVNKELKDLKYSIGDGEDYKSINNIKWWDKYFYVEKKGIERKITEELIKLSGEQGIPYDGIYPPYANGEILVFHNFIYKIFKERLEKDIEFKIMAAYRKVI